MFGTHTPTHLKFEHLKNILPPILDWNIVFWTKKNTGVKKIYTTNLDAQYTTLCFSYWLLVSRHKTDYSTNTSSIHTII
jgi:hypothetical protein